MTGIGRLAVTLEEATDKSSSFDGHHSRRTLVRFKFDTPYSRRVNISAELSAVASCGGFFALTVGGDARGWHPLAQSYADGFADLIDVTIKRYGTSESRIGASLVHLGHATRLWSPALACALEHGVVPDLTDLQRADDGTQLRLPQPLGDRVDSPAHDVLYRVVVQDHMERLEAGMRDKLAPALLSGNIASALVGASRALLTVRPGLRGPIAGTTRSLLNTGRLAGSGDITSPDLGFRRRSCCLLYRVPAGGKCGDCAL